MLGCIVNHLEIVMTFQGVFLLTWASILVTNAVIVKRFLKIGPGYYESDQDKLFRWNPVGVASLIIASGLGTIAALGFLGTFLQSTAAFFASILAAILTVVFAVMTKGKYYIKKENKEIEKED